MGKGDVVLQSGAKSETFESVNHFDLIDAFYASQGEDAGIGRELTRRLFEHAEFSDDLAASPLTGRDGSPVEQDGKPLLKEDYVNYAATHHTYALENILDFLLADPGSDKYKSGRDIIAGWVQPDVD